MRVLPTLLACALALAPVLGSGAARADDASSPREQSRASFRRGVSLAEHGDYTAARDAFIEAYRLFPHPSILLNLGIARWRTGELVQAEQDLAKFLADDGGASNEEIASARAALLAVRDRLGTVRLSARPDAARATLDGKAIALVPGGAADVRATLGKHALVVEADGYARAQYDVDVTRGQATRIDAVLVPLAFGGHEASNASSGAHPGGANPGGANLGDARATTGWTLVGLAGVSAAVGTVTGVRALSLSSAYGDKTSPDYQESIDQEQRHRAAHGERRDVRGRARPGRHRRVAPPHAVVGRERRARKPGRDARLRGRARRVLKDRGRTAHCAPRASSTVNLAHG